MKKLFYLFVFLFISSFAYSQGTVMERYNDGKKKYVNIYTGSGIAEKLTKSYYYNAGCNNVIQEIRYYDSKGKMYKNTKFHRCTSKISWSSVYSHKTDKTTDKSYNEDGTLMDGYPKVYDGNKAG